MGNIAIFILIGSISIVVVFNQIPSPLPALPKLLMHRLFFFLQNLHTLLRIVLMRIIASLFLVIAPSAFHHHFWAFVQQMRFQLLVIELFYTIVPCVHAAFRWALKNSKLWTIVMP